MRENLKKMADSRKQDEFNELPEEEKIAIKEKEARLKAEKEADLEAYYRRIGVGGKKKMKTRRNKIKRRKSRKSNFSKNTRKRRHK